MIHIFKKIVLFIFILLVFFLSAQVEANNDNQDLVYREITKEELNGEIQIPNENGGFDTYSDIDTYEDLYSVLEDLSCYYTSLLEDYNNSEKNIEELQSEIENLQSEIKDLEEENKKLNTKLQNSSGIDWGIIIVAIIIFGVPFSIYCFFTRENKK